MSSEPTLGSNTQPIKSHFEWLDRSILSLIMASVTLIIVGGLIQISFGAYTMSIGQVWQELANPAILFDPALYHWIAFGGEFPYERAETRIVWTTRLPRVLVAILVGLNLSISGAIFQAVTRNELASPYILGVSAGAGLAILLTLVFFGGLMIYLPLFASIGGIVAFLLVYGIAWKNGTNPVRLILAGVIVGTVFNSLQTALFLFIDDISVVQSAIAWTTGSLTGTGWGEFRLILPWTILTASLTVVAARQLNVLLLGEETASSLGMSVERVRFALCGLAILAAAASVAVAGIVGFVGLIVPHMVRSIVGSDHKRLIVGCLFVGPALLVVADVGARLALSPMQLPVGIITGLVGGPYFLYLMRKKQRLGEL